MTRAAPAPRLTPARQAVVDVLTAATDHPTAADVFDRVRRVHPGMGAATVYRTLGLLVETGRARMLSLGDGAGARYDANTSRHDHLVCTGCGRAVDVDLPIGREVLTGAAAVSGFDVTGYDLQLHGRCPACRGNPG